MISDLRRKAALNSSLKVIRVEIEGGEPVQEGTIFYHRLQKGPRIFEYRSRCERMVPPHLFVSRSQTDPPFEVVVTVESAPEGCRLTQEETVAITPGLLDTLEPVSAAERTLRGARLFMGMTFFRHLESDVRRIQRERLVKRLRSELQAWLDAIKADLETQNTQGK